MSRHKQFERHDALDRAMRQFWAKGYAGTSVQDLVDATGVNRASLYATFGDKRALFLAAIDHYVSEVSSHRLAKLAEATATRAAIRRYFDDLIAFSVGDGRGLGCLLTNSTIEHGPHDPAVAKCLSKSLGRVEATLIGVLGRGQEQGTIDGGRSPEDLAKFLLCTIQGLRVLARAGAPEIDLRKMADVALDALS